MKSSGKRKGNISHIAAEDVKEKSPSNNSSFKRERIDYQDYPQGEKISDITENR